MGEGSGFGWLTGSPLLEAAQCPLWVKSGQDFQARLVQPEDETIIALRSGQPMHLLFGSSEYPSCLKCGMIWTQIDQWLTQRAPRD